jgi:hypothetical protein
VPLTRIRAGQELKTMAIRSWEARSVQIVEIVIVLKTAQGLAAPAAGCGRVVTGDL